MRTLVSRAWADDAALKPGPSMPVREHALPTAGMHLVIRLADAPLLVSSGGARPQALGGALIGGARSRFYVRELAAPSCSVGVVLRPGAALRLFGVAADELAGTHTPLEDVWGAAATACLRERMRAARTPQARLALLEAELLARLARSRHGMHPAIAHVLEVLPSLPSVHAAVRLSGLSHRQFIVHFRQAVGLAPKAWLRVQRFQRALKRLHAATEPLAAVAADAGYADQAHFSREFQALAGVTPGAYRAIAPREANHLPVPHAAC